MMSIEQGKNVLLVVLDLSATFDAVDHNVHFPRLKDMFDLEQRSQRVSVHGILSDVQCLLSGVPQGSVLCPLVVQMYARPLGMLMKHNCIYL